MVGSTMLLSVYMPHSCRDEGDYIEALDTVRATLTEGKKQAGAVDFIIGGDINIEVRLGSTGEDGTASTLLNGTACNGPECKR